MSIREPLERRVGMNPKQAFKNQLWNVSLLPICTAPGQGSGAPEPLPPGGSSPSRPALLTVTEAPAVTLASAA